MMKTEVKLTFVNSTAHKKYQKEMMYQIDNQCGL